MPSSVTIRTMGLLSDEGAFQVGDLHDLTPVGHQACRVFRILLCHCRMRLRHRPGQVPVVLAGSCCLYCTGPRCGRRVDCTGVLSRAIGYRMPGHRHRFDSSPKEEQGESYRQGVVHIRGRAVVSPESSAGSRRYCPQVTAPTVRVDPSRRFQSILGMGSSFEEASVYHLMRMRPEVRHRVLRDLVHPEDGVGWNLMRICFGTSDFTSVPWYSYDDMPPGQTDPDLKQFSIQRDIDLHILDVIREAMALNPELRIFASPWSPPGWIKSNGSMCGGSASARVRGPCGPLLPHGRAGLSGAGHSDLCHHPAE